MSGGRIAFSKYHGLGNDFLIVLDQAVDAGMARRMCDRHLGPGADGLISLRRSEVADFAFVLFNADGGQAEVSGNGLRCVGKFLFEKGHHRETTIKVEAGGEVKVLDLMVSGGMVESVRADMGVPVEHGEVTLHGMVWKLVSTGNPHAVTFVDDIGPAPVAELGPLMENDPFFPNRTNVEFVQRSGDILEVRFWERGVGPTLASGTGSCAAVVASGLSQATVRTLGGELEIERGQDGRLFMTGPAVHVYDGELA